MFDVVRSPWMIPARWRRPTISPIAPATFIAAGPPLSRTSFAVGPSMNSMTILFSTRLMSYRIGTATPAARASDMRRASWRMRDPRSTLSRTSRRYAFGTRCFSMAARPRNSVRRSSASAPRLTSTRRDARRPRKTFHRLVHRVADDQTETGDAPHPSRQPGRSTGVATNAGGALARRDPREAPRRDGRIPAGERSRGLRCRAPEWGARGVRGGDDPPPCRRVRHEPGRLRRGLVRRRRRPAAGSRSSARPYRRALGPRARLHGDGIRLSPRERGQPSGAPRDRVRRAGAAHPLPTMVDPPLRATPVVEKNPNPVTTPRGMRGLRARALWTASDRSPAAGSGHTAVRAAVPPTG